MGKSFDGGFMIKKDEEWLKSYNYSDSGRYKIGDIDFIKNRQEHPCRFFFADWVINTPSIESILEAGPGEMVEYNLIIKELGIFRKRSS